MDRITTAAALSLALLLGGSGCGAAQTKMNPNDPFLTAEQIREIAGRTASATLPDEVAETLPVITEAGRGPRVLIVFYSETGPPHARTVRPPHYFIELDPASGKVLRFSRCRPEDLGIAMPLVRVPGVDYDETMGVDAYIQLEDRFLAISPAVWRLFLNRSQQTLDEESRKLIGEYWNIFSRITTWETAPFYIGAAADFFGWVRSNAGK